jgi:non-specific serine/threonine protein kinase
MRLSRQAGGDPYAEAYGRQNLGLVAVSRLDYQKATAQLEEALPLYLECGDMWAAAQAHILLGIVLILQNNHDKATPRVEEGLAMAHRVGDSTGVYMALYNLALVALIQGKYELASSRFGEGMALSMQMEDQAHIAYCLEGLAAVAGMQEKVERSVHLFGAAEELLEDLGVPVYCCYNPDRSLYERTIADLRILLGEAAFEEAWAEGKKMTLEEAVAYGQSGRGTVPFAPTPQRNGERPSLTRREEEIAALVAQGLTNRQIASELSISEHTAATHVARILRKLDLHSRSQLTAWVTERSLRSSDAD